MLVTVVLAEAPWATETLAGDTITEKPVSTMVSPILIVWVIPPPDAVTGIT